MYIHEYTFVLTSSLRLFTVARRALLQVEVLHLHVVIEQVHQAAAVEHDVDARESAAVRLGHDLDVLPRTGLDAGVVPVPDLRTPGAQKRLLNQMVGVHGAP